MNVQQPEEPPTRARVRQLRNLARRPLFKAPLINRHERIREISFILARHGLGYLVDVAGWDTLIPFHRGFLGHPQRKLPYTPPEHVRMALEQMGTVAVKLGHMLSTRADLLPPAYQHELALLQDAVPPTPGASIRQVVTSELGRPVEMLFAAFEDTPLAAASIGQVHAATLVSGAEVVVKVRRPGVTAQVEADLAILAYPAKQAAQRLEIAARMDVEGLVAEFAHTLRAELDYRSEAQNAEHFARDFADDPLVTIPHVYQELTTVSVLTLARLRGVKISDTTALAVAGHDREELAQRVSYCAWSSSTAYITQICIQGTSIFFQMAPLD